jgi:hypothetical protein
MISCPSVPRKKCAQSISKFWGSNQFFNSLSHSIPQPQTVAAFSCPASSMVQLHAAEQSHHIGEIANGIYLPSFGGWLNM